MFNKSVFALVYFGICCGVCGYSAGQENPFGRPVFYFQYSKDYEDPFLSLAFNKIQEEILSTEDQTLTPDQQGALTQAIVQIRKKWESLDPAEVSLAAKYSVELSRELDKKFNAILTPSQLHSLRQSSIQTVQSKHGRLSILNNESVKQLLGLTQIHIEKIEAAIRKENKTFLRRGTTVDFQELRNAESRVIDVLPMQIQEKFFDFEGELLRQVKSPKINQNEPIKYKRLEYIPFRGKHYKPRQNAKVIF